MGYKLKRLYKAQTRQAILKLILAKQLKEPIIQLCVKNRHETASFCLVWALFSPASTMTYTMVSWALDIVIQVVQRLQRCSQTRFQFRANLWTFLVLTTTAAKTTLTNYLHWYNFTIIAMWLCKTTVKNLFISLEVVVLPQASLLKVSTISSYWHLALQAISSRYRLLVKVSPRAPIRQKNSHDWKQWCCETSLLLARSH